MTFPKRPLLVPIENSYPDKAGFKDRIKRLVRVGAIGAAGLLITGCDHIAEDNGVTPGDYSEEYSVSATDSETATETDTGYLAGGEVPDTWPTDSETATETDSGYLPGDTEIAPSTDSVVIDTGTDIDTGYLAGDIAPSTDSAIDTAIDTAVDTDIGVDTDSATSPPADTDSATEIDTGIIAGAIE